jgi:hypothetical protein
MGLGIFADFIAYFAAMYVFVKAISLGKYFGAPDNGHEPKNAWQWVWFLFSMLAFFITGFGLSASLR